MSNKNKKTFSYYVFIVFMLIISIPGWVLGFLAFGLAAGVSSYTSHEFAMYSMHNVSNGVDRYNKS